jgi:hypothetical protein
MIELRVQQIVIDVPTVESIPFVAVVVQRLIYDENDKLIQTINREKMINRSLMSVAMNTYSYEDPFPSEKNQISGAGLASAIRVAARSWVLEEYPGSTLIDGRVILDAGN